MHMQNLLIDRRTVLYPGKCKITSLEIVWVSWVKKKKKHPLYICAKVQLKKYEPLESLGNISISDIVACYSVGF